MSHKTVMRHPIFFEAMVKNIETTPASELNGLDSEIKDQELEDGMRSTRKLVAKFLRAAEYAWSQKSVETRSGMSTNRTTQSPEGLVRNSSRASSRIIMPQLLPRNY